MTPPQPVIKLRRGLRGRGLLGLPGWAARWLYWNVYQRLNPATRSEAAALAVKNSRVKTAHPICDDVREWCARNPGSAYQALVARGPLQRALPRTLEPSVDATFATLTTVEAPERALVQVPGGRLVGPAGLVVLPDGSFVGELVALTPAGRRDMLSQEPGFTAPLAPPARRLSGPHYALTVIGWQNYYHWLHDVVLRLPAVLPQLPAGTRFIVPAGLRPFHYASLELIGIKPEQLVLFSGQETWEAEQLIFSTPIHKTQITSAAAAQWLRDLARQRFATAAPAPRRILVGRLPERDNHYRFTNQGDIEAALKPFGFELCFPHDLSLAEQVQLFSQAELIVGTGTGLANILFAPAGAKVLQLQEPSKIIHALWTLSEALGHEYWYLLGDTVPNKQAALPDIFVPIEKLTRTVERMLTA